MKTSNGYDVGHARTSGRVSAFWILDDAMSSIPTTIPSVTSSIAKADNILKEIKMHCTLLRIILAS